MSSAVPAITPIPVVTVMAVVSGIAKKKTKRRTVKIWGCIIRIVRVIKIVRKVGVVGRRIRVRIRIRWRRWIS